MGRILVIEDDPGNQLLYQSKLRELGHDVVVSSTGAQGIAQARSSAFDLHLVDMHLGEGVDGIEVCRRLKRDPEMRDVPVVLISAKIRESADLREGYKAGCEAFLVKKDLTLLEDVVRAMLRLKALRDELATQMGLLQQRNELLQQALRDKDELEDKLARTTPTGTANGQAMVLADGILIVDPDGTVASADRGAQEIFARGIEGRSLGNLAPGTRLEAFVRDARTQVHRGFRFTIPARGTRIAQNLVACAFPLVPKNVGAEVDLRVVLLFDERKQSMLWETMQAAAGGVALAETGELVEIARREFVPARILGDSPEMTAIRARVNELCASSEPVLLTGEEGTGKSHLARVLHFASERTGPFVPIGCADLGRGAVESALFGEDGHPGLLQQAHSGTLYLEDVDKLPHAVQALLVEVRRQGVFSTVSKKPRKVDVRIVASTQRPSDSGDLHPEFQELFRTSTIALPALRERLQDLPVLVRAFLARYALDGESTELSDEGWAAFENYEWPGNLRELEAVIEHVSAVAGPSAVIDVTHLPKPLSDVHQRLAAHGQVTPRQPPDRAVRGTHQPPFSSSKGLPDVLRRLLDDVIPLLPEVTGEEIPVSFAFFEKWALNLALSRSQGDKLKAAKMLQVGKSTFYRKLNKYQG